MFPLRAFSVLTLVHITFVHGSPHVNTSLGPVEGNEITVEGKTVNEFVGIPFAKPPVGPLRFKKPVPVTEKWTTPLKAKSFSNSCIQFSEGVSEDCLYINVWNVNSDNKSTLKPVMFWTYGGGFVFGSAKKYNGSVLAALSDCLVVTYNYRLGPFGFLFGNTENAPGNVALFDQLLALKWVNENIEYFGGDKNRVTIFGESAGSMSTSFHLISPLSVPYYKRAIMMSGVGIDFMNADLKEWAVRRSKALAEVLGCNSTSSNETLTNDQIQCLQSQSPMSILKASDDQKVVRAAPSLAYNTPFLPIFGDDFLPHAPRKLWKDKQFKVNTELLIGTVYNEVSDQIQQIPSFLKPSLAARLYCYKFPDQFLNNSQCDELIKIYFLGVDEKNNREAAIDAALQMHNDIFFQCDTLSFAEAFSEINKVHQYFFVYKSKNDPPQCGPKHTCHTSDLAFTFGNVRNEEDREATLNWIQILANFTRTGDAFWPEYYKTNENQLIPVYYEFNGTQAQQNEKIGLKNFRCEIWESMVLD